MVHLVFSVWQRDFLCGLLTKWRQIFSQGCGNLPVENAEHLVRVATKWHKCFSLLTYGKHIKHINENRFFFLKKKDLIYIKVLVTRSFLLSLPLHLELFIQHGGGSHVALTQCVRVTDQTKCYEHPVHPMAWFTWTE